MDQGRGESNASLHSSLPWGHTQWEMWEKLANLMFRRKIKTLLGSIKFHTKKYSPIISHFQGVYKCFGTCLRCGVSVSLLMAVSKRPPLY